MELDEGMFAELMDCGFSGESAGNLEESFGSVVGRRAVLVDQWGDGDFSSLAD